MLEVRGLDVRYGTAHVVHDLDMVVSGGEVVALLGRNGAGKTTTLLGILGLVPGRSGQVVVSGQDVSAVPAHRRIRAGIAYVPSGARCFANLTVAENLEIAARVGGEARWNQRNVCELFPRLGELLASMAGGLSGGERQMLAVGRALMSNPRIILMDEPTEGLAPAIVQVIGRLIGELRQAGIGILLAEQNHRMALRVADRAVFMEKGRVIDELPADVAATSQTLQRVLGV